MVRRVLFRCFLACLSSAVIGTALLAQKAGFVYVVNCCSSPNDTGPGNVSAYAIEGETGALLPVPGSPFAAGVGGSGGIAVDPAGQFLFVGNHGDPTINTPPSISVYTIEGNSGTLTPVAGSPFPAPNSGEMTVDPSGRFLYMSGPPTVTVITIDAFAIDRSTGAVSPVPGSPFSDGATVSSPAIGGALSVTVDPTGQFLFATNRTGSQDNVSALRIDSSSGALSLVPGSPFAVPGGGNGGNDVWGAVMDPHGKFVFVSECCSLHDGVVPFAIDHATGAPTPVPGSPFTKAGDPPSLTVDPQGKFVYGSGFATHIFGMRIDRGTAALTPVPGSPYSTIRGLPIREAVDPTGKFLYITTDAPFSTHGETEAFSIDRATGALTIVPGSPFSAGVGPNGIVTTSGPGCIALPVPPVPSKPCIMP
jgi:6-phosphogluconolactonase